MDRETASAIVESLTESEKLRLYEVLLSIERERKKATVGCECEQAS